MWNVFGMSISSKRTDTAKSAFFLFLFLSVVSCGGKGGPPPSAPGVAPEMAVEAPQKTSLSVAVEGLAPEEERTILLLNARGEEIARAQITDGKAALEALLQSSKSRFFAVKIKGKEATHDLDAGVKIEAGQKEISVRVTSTTTLAFFLAKTYNASDERALRRAIEFYEPLLRSMETQNPGLVERALLELQTPPKDTGTFTGGANAFRQILDEVFSRLHSDTSP